MLERIKIIINAIYKALHSEYKQYVLVWLIDMNYIYGNALQFAMLTTVNSKSNEGIK